MKKYFDGEKLKKLRKSKGLTTQQVADLINVSQSYISRFENNKAIPDVDMLQKILEVLGSNISDFYNPNELPPDLIQLMETAKKLSVEDRKLLNQFITNFKGVHSCE